MRFFTFLLVTVLTPSLARAAFPDLSKQTPIIITKDAAESEQMLINNKQFDRRDAERWLHEVSLKFGRKDPVIILVERETKIGVALDLVEMARRSHDNVYGIIKGFSLSQPLLLFSSNPGEDLRSLLPFLPPAPGSIGRRIWQPMVPNGTFIDPPKELIEQFFAPTNK